MISYFADDGNWARLLKEVEGWRGTPFWEAIGARARKGVAADCVSYVGACMIGAGAIGGIPWPASYVTHGGGEAMLRTLLLAMDGIEGLPEIWHRLDTVPRPPVERGDILVVSSGKALHHLAIYMGGNRVTHCLAKYGVTEGNLFDPLIAKHMVAIYRAVR